jgi:hypothetical protein
LAAAPGWTSNTDAVKTFTEDVLAAGRDRAAADDPASFALWLAEVVELAAPSSSLWRSKTASSSSRARRGRVPPHDRTLVRSSPPAAASSGSCRWS